MTQESERTDTAVDIAVQLCPLFPTTECPLILDIVRATLVEQSKRNTSPTRSDTREQAAASPSAVGEVTVPMVLGACAAYTRALSMYGSRVRSTSAHEVGMRAALEATISSQAPKPASAAMDFIQAMRLCDAGLAKWKAKPHNAKWWQKIDGTPIPNDLLCCIANQFAEPIDGGIGQEDEAP